MSDFEHRAMSSNSLFSLDRLASPPMSPGHLSNQSIYQSTQFSTPTQHHGQLHQLTNPFNQFEDLSFFTGFPRIDSLGSLASFDQSINQSNHSVNQHQHQIQHQNQHQNHRPQSVDHSISHAVNSDLMGSFAPDDFSPILTGINGNGPRYQSNQSINQSNMPPLQHLDSFPENPSDQSINYPRGYAPPTRQLRYQPQQQQHQTMKNHSMNQSIHAPINQSTNQFPDSNAVISRKRVLEPDSFNQPMYPMSNQSMNPPMHRQSVSQVRHTDSSASFDSYPVSVSYNQSVNYSQHVTEQSVDRKPRDFPITQFALDQSTSLKHQQPVSQSVTHIVPDQHINQLSDLSLHPSASQKTPRKSACAACYTAKIHCNGGRPCSRCESKNATCEDRVKHSIKKNNTKRRKVSNDESDKPNSTIDLTSPDVVKKESMRSDESVASTSSEQSTKSGSEASSPVIQVSNDQPTKSETDPQTKEEKFEPAKTPTNQSINQSVDRPIPVVPEKIDPARESSRRMLNILLHEKSDLPGTIKAGLKMGTVTPVNLHGLLSYFSRTLYPDDRHTLMKEVQKLLSTDPTLSKIVVSTNQSLTQSVQDHSSIYMPDGSTVPRVTFNFFRSPLEPVPESPIGVDHPSIWIFRLWPDQEAVNNESKKKFFRRMFKMAGQTPPAIYMRSPSPAPTPLGAADGMHLIVQVNRAFELLFDYRQSEMRALMQKEGTQALYRLYRPESLYEIGGWLTQAICLLRHDFKAEVKLMRRGCTRHMDGVMNARFTLDSNRQFESVGYTYVTKTRNS